jgi:hypothetical protein
MTGRNRSFDRRAVGLAVTASLLAHLVVVLGGWMLGSADRDKPAGRARSATMIVWENAAPGEVDVDSAVPPFESELQEPPADVEQPCWTGPVSLVGSPSLGGTADTESGPAVSDHAHSSGGGASQKSATFFEVPVRSARVVFLIDRSTSMGIDGGLRAAKHQMNNLLKCLPDTTRFQIIVYNTQQTYLTGRSLQFATPTHVEAALKALETIGGAGGTNHYEAIRLGLDLQPDELFLLTDTCDLTPQQMRALTEWNHGRTIVHTLAWGRLAVEEGDLKRFAAANGGTHRRAVVDDL